MFRIWKYLPTFVFCTFVTIAQEPHHSLLSNGDQSEGIYITQIIRPKIWAQECTCTNRYIKMGPIKGLHVQLLDFFMHVSSPGIEVLQHVEFGFNDMTASFE